ncbi:hypothetical protein ABNX05_11070 [Lysinibacillus sp. M3]|uniref:Uncharacterized protein n=1 Tax=Lysinibacillus zambalensis TaxID=3160866 RepID=A0ABV1MSR5_9BACI
MKVDDLINFTNNNVMNNIDKILVEIIKEDGSKEIVMGHDIKLSPEDYDFEKDTYKKISINGIGVLNDK